MRGKKVLPGLLVRLPFGTDPICDCGTESERQSRAAGRCRQRVHVRGDEERDIRVEARKCLWEIDRSTDGQRGEQ